MTALHRTLVLALCLLAAVPAFAQDSSLRELAQRRGFYVGAAVSMRPLRAEPVYREILGREFNVVVAENAFKFSLVRPRRGRYDFRQTDRLAAFASEHAMKLRGHTLVWHQQLPRWMTRRRFTRDEAIELMREHIHTLVGRYRGQIWAWDVVNEAVADDGSGLRTKSFWYETIGPEYVELAFRFAREADPGALLYYNDYAAEDMGAKSNKVYELLRDLKQRGVPVDGVGWQMHLVNGFRITDAHRANARRLADLGLELSVTELDVRIELPVDPGELESQAAAYRDVMEFCLADPNFKAVLSWGFTDKHSWIPGWFKGYGAALPLDAAYRPKPAYAAMHAALAAEKWPARDQQAALEPLRVSADGRYLVTASGKRFFYLADTAWELFHRLTREETELYLEDRASKGFTAVQAVVLPELGGPNAYGHVPLVNNDPRTGTSRAIGTFQGSGERRFTPPSSGEGNDWVLVVDGASRRLPPLSRRAGCGTAR